MTLLDPVTFAVLTKNFVAIAREMSTNLLRSAYSPVIREAADASTAFLDPQGRVIAQAENIPLHLNSMPPAFAACQAALGAPADDDEVWINNDPYSGGQHLSDIFLFRPVFHEGRLIGYTASVGHYIDLGHSLGFNLRARDMYEERMRFAPMRFSLSRDWNDGILPKIIESNVRMPRYVLGDLDAQLTANAIGADRLRSLASKYGTDTLLHAFDDYLDYAERRTRAQIHELPDGVFEAEDWVDDDGLGPDAIPVRVQIRIAGDQIHVAFAGTGAQVRGAINCPLASTVSAAMSAIKSALNDLDLPLNAGCYRPVTIEHPPLGSILNPASPAPVEARALPVIRVFSAVIKALAKAAPERVAATGYDTRTSIDLHHTTSQGHSGFSDLYGGGYGASHRHDGADQVDDPLGNCTNTPVEALENSQDFFRVTHYGLLRDSGGPGRTRGGMGASRGYEILRDNIYMTAYSDRFTTRPEGLLGGEPGTTAAIGVNRASGEHEEFPSKGSTVLNRGDVVTVAVGGGGGYGDARERPVELVERDLREDRVSAEAAKIHYGYDT
ncbi:hydantoinase B/oxoprolinase family protein [Nonomuraea sp. NPDC049129]|uniref:hydantoinase B/oxoprolinase family protein n=1 Tax=unclassified Nonomuraea TaxID=2593643 RepID=UPI0033C7AE0F